MDAAFKSYLVRAAYEYCIDHGLPPYLIARARDNDTLPAQHVEHGAITLNLSNQAIRDLVIEREQLSFATRFGGVATAVKIPIDAVVWIGCPRSECAIGFARQQSEAAGALPPREPAGSKLRLL